MSPAPAQTDPAETLRRILVVDNSSSARKLVCAALHDDRNCEVLAVGSCADAERILRDDPSLDALVCDMNLDLENGADFIGRIRAEGFTLPVLITTVEGTYDSMARALEAGADDYLQKPLDVKELRRALAVLISCATSPTKPRPPYTRACVIHRTDDDGCSFELTAPTNSAQIESFQRFTERMIAPSLGDTDRVNLRLALEETIQNAREWGNQFDSGKMVRLSCCLLNDRIVIRVEDEGPGFDPNSIPDPSTNPKEHIKRRLTSGKRVGGWGLFLTRKIMDEVTFNSKGNAVCITKRFPPRAPSSRMDIPLPHFFERPPTPATAPVNESDSPHETRRMKKGP